MKMPNAIIACGQFTTCWNLLEYIYKLKKLDLAYTNGQLAIINLEPQLKKHWLEFKKDPFWMIRNDYNT